MFLKGQGEYREQSTQYLTFSEITQSNSHLVQPSFILSTDSGTQHTLESHIVLLYFPLKEINEATGKAVAVLLSAVHRLFTKTTTKMQQMQLFLQSNSKFIPYEYLMLTTARQLLPQLLEMTGPRQSFALFIENISNKWSCLYPPCLQISTKINFS